MRAWPLRPVLPTGGRSTPAQHIPQPITPGAQAAPNRPHSHMQQVATGGRRNTHSYRGRRGVGGPAQQQQYPHHCTASWPVSANFTRFATRGARKLPLGVIYFSPVKGPFASPPTRLASTAAHNHMAGSTVAALRQGAGSSSKGNSPEEQRAMTPCSCRVPPGKGP